MRARKQLSNGFYRVAVFERSQRVVSLLLCHSELLTPHHDDDVQAVLSKHCVFAQAGQARGQLRASNRFCNRYS